MAYYLTRWAGTGTDADAYRPDLGFVPGTRWQAIDLRPDPTVAAGWAVVWTEVPAVSVPTQATFLGDGPGDQIPNNLRSRIRQALGLATLEGTTVPSLLRDLLTVRAQAGGWGALRPGRRGNVDHYEIHLGGLLTEWDEAAP